MEETQAAPSTATETVVETPQSFDIPRSNTPEYQEWRKSGELPKPKTEAPAASDAPKETNSDDAADSAATKTQESRRRPDVEDRFKKLTETHKAEMESLRRELDELRKPKETKAESSSAKQPQTYKEWRAEFKPAKWVEQYIKDNPEVLYEDATAAMADHLNDVRDQFRAAEQMRNDSVKRFNDSVIKAREVYSDFDSVAEPMAGKVNELIQNPAVDATLRKALFDPEAVHILYALGKDPELVEKFGKLALNDPAEAIFVWKTLKADALKELAKGGSASEATRNDRGQFTKVETATPPAKRGPESAPEPPIEIGARGTSTLNESDRAFQAIERGDAKAFRAWKDAENAKDLRRRRGA